MFVMFMRKGRTMGKKMSRQMSGNWLAKARRCRARDGLAGAFLMRSGAVSTAAKRTGIGRLIEGLGRAYDRACVAVLATAGTKRSMRVLRRLASDKGQGTTEYAILVGILVVIAVLAIAIFRPKIQELWDAISSSINAL